jgi:multimeric flavodoxin WrbA
MIIGICGSPREKNTLYMLKKVLDTTSREYELILLKDKNFDSCTACRGCYKTCKCVKEDDIQEIHEKMKKAEIIVLGSPTYFDNVTAIMKKFIDRSLPFYLSKELVGKKVGLVSVGNFKHDERKENKPCIWCKEETESVMGCIDAMEKYCKHLGFNIVGKVLAIHSEPWKKDEELMELGKKLVE